MGNLDAKTKDEMEITELIDESQQPQVEKLSSAFMSLYSEQRFISSTDKIAEKLTPEHITQIISNSEKEDLRAFSSFKWNAVVRFATLVISLVFAVFLLIFFRESEHFTTILTAIFSFLGGLGLGRFVVSSKK